MSCSRGALLEASKLLETRDAFLLEHNSKSGRDKACVHCMAWHGILGKWTGDDPVERAANLRQIWSDNLDGSGKNWLGLQLMLLRDQLRGRCLADE